MKILLGTILVLTTLSALAHPGDNDPVRMIGIGTQLRVLEDINIKPTSFELPLARTQYSYCALSYDRKPYDRVIKKDTVFTVTSYQRINYIGDLIHLDGKTPIKIDCFTMGGPEGVDSQVTIGELKKQTRYLLEITLPEPELF